MKSKYLIPMKCLKLKKGKIIINKLVYNFNKFNKNNKVNIYYMDLKIIE